MCTINKNNFPKKKKKNIFQHQQHRSARASDHAAEADSSDGNPKSVAKRISEKGRSRRRLPKSPDSPSRDRL